MQHVARHDGTSELELLVSVDHAGEVQTQVWVVDHREDMERLLAWGVDGLISDRPDVAAQVPREELTQVYRVEDLVMGEMRAASADDVS